MQNLFPNGPQVFPHRDSRTEAGGAPEPTVPQAPPTTHRNRASGAARLRAPKSPARGAVSGSSFTSLRARAMTAGELERARTEHEDRLRRTAELQRLRDELVQQMFFVLDERVSPEAIALPEDPLAKPFLVLTVEVDTLRFSITDHPTVNEREGNSRLKVFLTCLQCGDGNWHFVPSLSALGSLLLQVEDGTITDICATCLMCDAWESDPFRDE